MGFIFIFFSVKTIPKKTAAMQPGKQDTSQDGFHSFILSRPKFIGCWINESICFLAQQQMQVNCIIANPASVFLQNATEVAQPVRGCYLIHTELIKQAGGLLSKCTLDWTVVWLHKVDCVRINQCFEKKYICMCLKLYFAKRVCIHSQVHLEAGMCKDHKAYRDEVYAKSKFMKGPQMIYC